MNINELKNKILQLAIQGKLVPQDENDIPASVLLEEIKKEKEQLIKEKKIKKEKPLPEITEEEKPFKIPKGWEWVRLGMIANIIMGQSPDSSYVSEDKNGIEFHQGKTAFGKKILDKSGLFCKKPTKVAEAGDILLSVRAPVGAVNFTDREVCIGRGLTAVRAINNKDNRFIFYIIKALEKELISKATGTTFLAISSKEIKELVIPLPSVAEQHRIVQKVDELFEIVDELAENKEAMLKNISDTRNKILQLAIQGKLVEQNPEETPASLLLEEIRKEKELLIKEKKIKKEKLLPEITEEEKPFEIPKGWEWVRFAQITFCRDGERVAVSSKDRSEREKVYDYYGASGVIDKIDSYIFDKPLLLIGEDGANLISRSTPIAFIATGQYWVNNHAHVIDSLNIIILKYLEVYINAIDLKPYVTGTAQPKLNQANLNNILVPLPSVAEQLRIVEKVDEIMAYLDELEKTIM